MSTRAAGRAGPALLNARDVVDGRPVAVTWQKTLEQTQSAQERATLMAFSKRNEKLVSKHGWFIVSSWNMWLLVGTIGAVSRCSLYNNYLTPSFPALPSSVQGHDRCLWDRSKVWVQECCL